MRRDLAIYLHNINSLGYPTVGRKPAIIALYLQIYALYRFHILLVIVKCPLRGGEMLMLRHVALELRT